MENKDPDLIAKNAAVAALFYPLTGNDPFLGDSLRSGIDSALSGEDGAPASFDSFMSKALELSRRRGMGRESAVGHVNLRGRAYEPLWVRGELVGALRPMTGCRRSILVVSGLSGAVIRALPKRRRRTLAAEALAEARRYIDALASRFAAGNCQLTVLYLD